MAVEPAVKRAVAFIDGQNLFHAAKKAFGHQRPCFDPVALSHQVCRQSCWTLDQVRFYTGVPDALENPKWNTYWNRKLLRLSRQGVFTYSRPLRYREKSVPLIGGGSLVHRVGEEKGIDVRIAIDIIRLAHRQAYDVGIIFSQDQDLSEVAREIRVIAQEQNRWIKLACAFPVAASGGNVRGIQGTDWKRLERMVYEACLDPNDHEL